MKVGRLLGILHYLLAHGRTPARVLAQRFEVTERTILRDMDDLSEFGVPVYAIQGQGGGWEIDRRYVLPAGLLQEQSRARFWPHSKPVRLMLDCWISCGPTSKAVKKLTTGSWWTKLLGIKAPIYLMTLTCSSRLFWSVTW